MVFNMKTEHEILINVCRNLENEYRREMEKIHDEKGTDAYVDVRYNHFRGMADAYASILDAFGGEEQ